jgi:nicotinate-nucleotide--dimethylbenzimidazole phosphoribosyltransferase
MDSRPFDDIRTVAARLPPLEPQRKAVAQRIAALPDAGAAVRSFQPVLERFAAVRGRFPFQTVKPTLILFAATHAADGPSALAQAARLAALAAGGMPVNLLCGELNAALKVFEMALDHPTPDIRAADAFDERGCAATIAFGMEAIAGEPDLLLASSVGSGGRVASICVLRALYPAEHGPLTMGETSGLARDAQAGLDRVPERLDPLEVLRRLGGRDVAALAGAILAARAQRIPVILDSLTGLAAAAVLRRLDPECVSHCAFAGAGDGLADFAGRVLALPATPAAGLTGDGAAAVGGFAALRLAFLLAARSPAASQLGLDA